MRAANCAGSNPAGILFFFFFLLPSSICGVESLGNHYLEACTHDPRTATFSVLCSPPTLPVATASRLLPLSSTHLIGPGGKLLVPLPSDGAVQCRALRMPASRSGSMPFVNVKRPPSWDGMFSGSMYFSSVGETSLGLRNTIFSAVTGSTNFLRTPHIVVMYEETLQT